MNLAKPELGRPATTTAKGEQTALEAIWGKVAANERVPRRINPPGMEHIAHALFGTRGKGAKRETVPLYALKESVRQAQEPELLPTKEQIGGAASKSMGRYIAHILRKEAS